MKPVFTYDFLGIQGSVKAYGFLMLVAAIIVLAISIYGIHKAGLRMKSSLICLFLMALAVPVGARILNIFINPGYYANNPQKILTLDTSGFSLMGGLLLAAITGIVASKVLKLDFWRLGDIVAPGLGIGLAVMRMGCFLNGCCFGVPSGLPWAVKFPFDSPAHRHYITLSDGNLSLFQMFRSPSVHPTQLYEIIGAIIAATLAAYLLRRGSRPGIPVLSAALVFTVTRLFNHLLRVHPITNEIPFWFYPGVYSVMTILIAMTLHKKVRTN